MPKSYLGLGSLTGTCGEVLTTRGLPSGWVWLLRVSNSRKNFSASTALPPEIPSRLVVASASQFDQLNERAVDHSGDGLPLPPIVHNIGQNDPQPRVAAVFQTVNFDLMMVGHSLRVCGVPRWPTEPMIPTQ